MLLLPTQRDYAIELHASSVRVLRSMEISLGWRSMSKKRRESTLESWAVKQCRDRGIVVAKMTECVGIPDRIFFLPGGTPEIVEFKADGEVPEALQSWYLTTLRKAGYHVSYCDTKEKFIALMNKRGVK